MRNVRFDVLKVFGMALAITMLLSLYLAGTIAQPICRLAEAADRVRRGQGRQTDDPRFHPPAATRSAISRARCAT